MLNWVEHKSFITLGPDLSSFENTVDPDHLVSNEATWSGSTLFSSLIDPDKEILFA